MPFEIPQKSPEVETQTGRFQKLADALLKGCAVTYPIKSQCLDNYGGACAIGALYVGLGADRLGSDWVSLDHAVTTEMEMAYMDRYATMLTADNDRGLFTREEIAARIAAL